ncbi:MAG: hypothetical protein WAL83_01480 [Arenicellales bacterium]
MAAVGHVRDAVEYVTHCVSRGRCHAEHDGAGCSRDMRFVWEVADGVSIALVRLREGFVPVELNDLLDRRGTPEEPQGDAGRLDSVKRRLVEKIRQQPLEGSFSVEVLETGCADHA